MILIHKQKRFLLRDQVEKIEKMVFLTGINKVRFFLKKEEFFMRMNQMYYLVIELCFLVGMTQAATKESQRLEAGASIDGRDYNVWEENYTIQALLGAAKYENLTFNVDGATQEIDLSLMPQLGGVWGTAPRGDYFQYGLECSFLFGFMTDDIWFYSTGGSSWIRVSASVWMVDFAGGGYLSLYLNKNRSARIYIAGGPLMTYLDYSSDSDEDAPIPEYDDQDESAFGVGVYARAGFEFRVYDAGMLGMGIRGTWSTINLSNVGGNSDLTGIAAFVSFTAGF